MKEITKDDLLKLTYENIQKNRDEWNRLSLLPLEDSEATFYVQESITQGMAFISNYQMHMVAKTTNPENTVYYINDENIPGFCPNELYKTVQREELKRTGIYDEETEDGIDTSVIPLDKEGERVYV